MNIQATHAYLLDLQSRITTATSALDGGTFATDVWKKPPTEHLRDNGCTCALKGSALPECGGVSFSHMMDDTLPPSATADRPGLVGRGSEAMGVSLVFHPRNPYVPTVYMNARCFVVVYSDAASVWRLGGGTDLTSYYGFTGDASRLHRICQGALAPYGDELYPYFK